MEEKLPLRARKKAKVREALIRTSFRLFSEKGYTETTLEQICEECDVTVQTLLRYFGSKDDLLFAKHPAILARFQTGLARATRRKASVEYWLKFLHSNARRVQDVREMRDSYRIIVGAPSLLSRFYSIGRQYAALLEQALLEEDGLRAEQDLHATLLANMVVMGPLEEALRAISQNEVGDLVGRIDAAAKYVTENFKRPTRPLTAAHRPSGRLAVRAGKLITSDRESVPAPAKAWLSGRRRHATVEVRPAARLDSCHEL